MRGARGGKSLRFRLLCFNRISKLAPALPPAIHRDHVLVTHLLERIPGKRGAKPAATIEDYLGIVIRDGLLDVTFDYSFAKVNGSSRVTLLPFVVLAHIDEVEALSRFLFSLHIFGGVFAHAALCIIDRLEESRRVLHCCLLFWEVLRCSSLMIATRRRCGKFIAIMDGAKTSPQRPQGS